MASPCQRHLEPEHTLQTRTHWVAEVADLDVQRGRTLVCLLISYDQGLESVLQFDKLILSVILI